MSDVEHSVDVFLANLTAGVSREVKSAVTFKVYWRAIRSLIICTQANAVQTMKY